MSFTEYLKDLGLKEKVDRLYLEKCQEVNRLERKLDGQKALLEERNKEIAVIKDELRKLKEAQSGDLISRAEAINEIQEAFAGLVIYPSYMQNYDVDYVKNQYGGKLKNALKRINAIPAVSGISAAERLHEEVEELWQEKSMVADTMADLAASAKGIGETIKALWREYNVAAEPQEVLLEQTITTQDILCLSSALRNLYEIHKCDGWLLYNRLSKVLDKAIEDYSGKVGVNE